MLVRTLPGASRRDARSALEMLKGELMHQARNPDPHSYLRWVPGAAYKLHNVLPESEIERLILTSGYQRIVSAHRPGAGPELGVLVELEIHARLDEVARAVEELRARVDAWSGPERFIAFDTNIFLEHEKKLEEIDFGGLAPFSVRDVGTGSVEQYDPAQHVRLIIPMAVVDELDDKKQSKDKKLRWRARHTLHILDEALPDPQRPGVLREAGYAGEDGSSRGEVTVEVLLDSPGHLRLPRNDDEIIDRVYAAQPLAARPIILITFDTGCSTRARAVGLCVDKLRQDEDDEEEPAEEPSEPSRRARRRERAAQKGRQVPSGASRDGTSDVAEPTGSEN